MSELKESKKIKIEEKIELKEIEMQGNPCKNSQNQSCRYDCCIDCTVNGSQTPYQSSKY